MLREGDCRNGISMGRSRGERESVLSGKVRLCQQGFLHGEVNSALELGAVTESQSIKSLASCIKEFGFCHEDNEVPLKNFKLERYNWLHD